MPNPINDWITATVQEWLAAHPLMAWLITHPLETAILTVLLLILFWGLLGSIARIAQNMWLFLLGLPLKLMQAGWQNLPKVSRQLFGWPKIAPSQQKFTRNDPADQAQVILQQLQSLHQQEAKLFEDLEKLLKQ